MPDTGADAATDTSPMIVLLFGVIVLVAICWLVARADGLPQFLKLCIWVVCGLLILWMLLNGFGLISGPFFAGPYRR